GDTRYLMASDAGYGFIARLEDLHTKNKAGKAVLALPRGARILSPAAIHDISADRAAAATKAGRLLVFHLNELPELAKGKGLKMVHIASAKVVSREDFVTALTVVPAGASLVVRAGQRHLTLAPADLAAYAGERGRKGNRLPRGFQNVSALQARQAGE
ncbi:MAG: DNA gyrase C-terminal beta-propeller domain-containing protein, partial [Gammaproteobacteria bacterium]